MPLRRSGQSLCQALALLVTVVLTSSCDPPAVVQVTSSADGASGSLRDAIEQANAANRGVRIEIPTGNYELTLCGSDDTSAAGDLDLTSAHAVSIIGTGPNVVIEQACAGERVLDARGSGALTLEGVTVTGGRASGDGGGIRA